MPTYEPSPELTKAVLAGIAAPLPFAIGLAYKAIPYKEPAMSAALTYAVPLSLRATASGCAAGTRVVLTNHGELTEEVKQSMVRRIAAWLVPSEVKEITTALQRELRRMADEGFAEEAWKLEVQDQEIVLVVLSETFVKVSTDTAVDIFLNSSEKLKAVSDKILGYLKPKT